jgi:hypothetical protein
MLGVRAIGHKRCAAKGKRQGKRIEEFIDASAPAGHYAPLGLRATAADGTFKLRERLIPWRAAATLI